MSILTYMQKQMGDGYKLKVPQTNDRHWLDSL